MKNTHSHAPLTIHRYFLQPGDMTAYRFFFASLDKTQAGASEGIDEDPDNFILIGIQMAGGSGIHEAHRSELMFNICPLYLYLRDKMPSVNQYTLAAVLLALYALVEDPDALDLAAHYMMQAPEMLAAMADVEDYHPKGY